MAKRASGDPRSHTCSEQVAKLTARAESIKLLSILVDQRMKVVDLHLLNTPEEMTVGE